MDGDAIRYDAQMSVRFGEVTAVVFDLGRVLIDVDPARTFALWSSRCGVAAADLTARFVADRAYERFERGEIAFSAYAKHVRRQLVIDADDDVIEEGWNALLGDALPSATEAITRAVRDYPCYLFSNSNVTHQAVWAREHGDLLAPLRRQFVSSDLGLRKPEPEAYARVAALIGVHPREILFFDDLAENVAAAIDAGYQAVRVDGPRDILDVFARAEHE